MPSNKSLTGRRTHLSRGLHSQPARQLLAPVSSDVRPRGNDMRAIKACAVIGLLLLNAILPVDGFATSCDPRASQEFAKYADWVFIGTVVEARQSESASHRIDFVATVLDPLRGSPPDKVELVASIGAYEPGITIGETYLIYVNSADRIVGYCRGFKVYGPDDFFQVLLMRKKGDCGSLYDRQVAVKYSREEFFENHQLISKADIEKILLHFQEVNPDLETLSTEGRLNVKGIDFMFIDNALVVIEVGKCAA